MQGGEEKPKKAPRKHVTTACVPCRESKIRCDGTTPNCNNCHRKGKECRYQHGEDKRKVSLRAATELFSARIDQLTQFIYDHGLEPPPMNPDDEMGMTRVLDTLRIPRAQPRRMFPVAAGSPQANIAQSPVRSPVPTTPVDGQLSQINRNTHISSPSPVPVSAPAPAATALPNPPVFSSPGNVATETQLPGIVPGVNNCSPSSWGFLPTAASLNTLYVDINGVPVDQSGLPPRHDASSQQPVLPLAQSESGFDSDSGEEEDEAQNEVIEQLSHRIGTLKIAGDGHLRFYGATSNLNLVDVSATQQRQRPDARTVRQDGQDILNHLRVGQPVDQAMEDHLVELYFTWQNPSAYVVNKEMYMIARSKWRTEMDETPFYSEVLTNAMCAIGSTFEARYHPTFITFPKSLSEFFADRAKALLEIELDSPCVATVQALVILASHEGASNRDARGWLYSGMSMRLAFDLGLHIDLTPYVDRGDMSAFEADVRRAAFWGSYIADHFWGFYLGRPFRMNAGDITVPKPASNLGLDKEEIWWPYGLELRSEALSRGLDNPNELISRQFAILWEMISPVGHILYGCVDISRHDLQRITSKVTEDLFAWKENLPSNLQIDLDNENVPELPHLLMLHMQYHQIVIFFHRPWVSKNYIQPRSPRQGPGYLHARQKCIESATAVARLLRLYEKHYTFRRMNNEVVSMIFTAALMLLFVTISTTPLTPPPSGADHRSTSNADMVAHLNLCFRALDELGQSVENAKRTRDFLVGLQRRWQTLMRRTGPALKRHLEGLRPPPSSSNPRADSDAADTIRKRSRTGPGMAMNAGMGSRGIPVPTSHRPSNSFLNPSNPATTTTSLSNPPNPPPHPNQTQNETQAQNPSQTKPFAPGQTGELEWIRNSDMQLVSDTLPDGFQQMVDSAYGEGTALPSLSDIEAWWDPSNFGENI
ncbi:hypothetical protein ASPZODRAFT_153088 [Penicilliopsis zonata CBS 506.65]|uniref:Zn(2)-C6 fungal-type domain-containing protein n=1 Tax=Penicilliopsis zonata CBS 506.65 TaxID=1073090 RepID=A0A1L9SEB5_9EURO|nr:hypothetical protein ASPZODRAFT_153088 [Penicilliopsis zonata CBS 506.65]OJJ45437.1 hypothetical protein ASPZODRAFT_153088 [Penicilliopsis zonata CBS 506.65]